MRKRLPPMREVCTRHSGRIAIQGNSIFASGGRTPTIVAVPRTARLSMAWRTRVVLPTASNAWSTPARPVSARTASTGSSFDVFTTWVAPTRRAISSLPSNRSSAMICRAPPMRAPCTIDSPTPPQPKTATVCPASSPALRSAAPTPVRTPQPTRAARSSGRSSSILTTEFSWSSMRSA